MPPIIGIDLGTTFSAVALVGQIGKPEIIPNREGERPTPSVVLFQDDAALVGEVARRSATTAPYDVVQFVKRQMGNPDWRFTASDGKQYGAEQVSSIILRRLKEDAALVIGEPVTDAVITVPAYFDDARRKATQDAGVITGLNVRRVLNEPTAAALAYGLDSRASGTVLVYDLGGGTFDVTVMRIADGVFDVIATMGDRNLGGFDWDNALMTYVNEQVMGADGPDVFDDDLLTAELREKGELLKRSLSSLNRAKLFLPAGGTVHTVEITRDTFEHITQGLLGRTEDITGQALDDANLGWPDIDHVLLVGGSTRMPMVRRMMERISSREPERGVNPDEAVALGAAVQAHLCAMADTGGGAGLPVLAGTDGKHVVVRDVAALGLGVLALDDGQLQRNWVLVPHNAKVPGWGSGDFNTVVENQQEIRVQVTEGDDPDPSYVKVVGDSVFQMPPYPKGAPIRIDINFDIDGIIHAQAFDATTGVKLGDMEIERISNLAPHEVKQARQNVEQLEIS